MRSFSKAKEDKKKDVKVPVVVIPVECMLPERGSISAYFETTTRVEAEWKVDILAEGIGECMEVFVEEGDTVKKGTVLAELDKKEAQASLSQAEVQMRQRKVEFDRAELASKDGLISSAEYDSAYFVYQQSVENRNMLQVRVDNLTIIAPIDGLVTTRHIQKGMLVSQGMAAFSIVDPTSFMVAINPPEKELHRLHIGQVAEVTIDALQGERFQAKVRRINPSVDPVRGTIKVLLEFEEETRKRLREAAFARVKLVMETHENVLLVAKDAVVGENARKYLFVAREAEAEALEAEEPAEPGEDDADDAEEDGGNLLTPDVEASVIEQSDAEGDDLDAQGPPAPRFVADRVEIFTGLEDSTRVEILSGIEEGDLLVTNGQHTLKPGSFLNVTNATEEILSKAGLDLDEALAAAQKRREGGELVQQRRGRRRHRGIRLR